MKRILSPPSPRWTYSLSFFLEPHTSSRRTSTQPSLLLEEVNFVQVGLACVVSFNGNLAYVGSFNGSFACVVSFNGNLAYVRSFNGNFTCVVSFNGNLVYLGSFNGNLAC